MTVCRATRRFEASAVPANKRQPWALLCRPPHASRPLPFLPRKPTTVRRSAQTCGLSLPRSGRFAAQTSPSRQYTRRLWGSCTLTAECHSGQGLLSCTKVDVVSAWRAAAPQLALRTFIPERYAHTWSRRAARQLRRLSPMFAHAD